QRLGDRLEEGRAADGAVAAAAGGQTVGDAAAGVERAAGVAGLGADVGLDEAGDDVAAAVVDRGVEGGDPAAARTRGGAVTDGGGAHARGGRTDDVHAVRGAGPADGGVGVPDDAVVVAREAGARRGAEHRGAAG